MNPKYITPRIAILQVNPSSSLQLITSNLQSYHKQYYHLFNISASLLQNSNLNDEKQKSTTFKWRGVPYSLTEMIKILTRVDIYLRINIANTAIICVSTTDIYQYALLSIKNYVTATCNSNDMSNLKYNSNAISKSNNQSSNGQKQEKQIRNIKIWTKTLTLNHQYFCQEYQQIYSNIQIKNPPVKIIQWLTVSLSTKNNQPSELKQKQQLQEVQQQNNIFIPLFDIYTESRYNQFEKVYSHDVEDQLSKYYLELHQPLNTSYGEKYYDEKPSTKYLKQPAFVYGDVKIVIYSYATLKKIKQFTVGFNTLNIDTLQQQQANYQNKSNDKYNKKRSDKDQDNEDQSKIITLTLKDFYEINQNVPKQLIIKIKYDDGCEKTSCKKESKCGECLQVIKKISNRYNEAQMDLNKLHRKRDIDEMKRILAI